jgi:hypothetical protein
MDPDDGSGSLLANVTACFVERLLSLGKALLLPAHVRKRDIRSQRRDLIVRLSGLVTPAARKRCRLVQPVQLEQ